MSIISDLFLNIYQAKYELVEQDAEYQAAKDLRNELERTLVMALTRKQRVLFHQYRNQQEALTALELRWIASHCSLILTLHEK